MIKNSFPIVKNIASLVYLDSAATALKPQTVINAVTDYYQNYSANIHRGIYSISEAATSAYEQARSKVAQFLNVAQARIVFTSGTTASLNQVAQSYRSVLTSSDEIIVALSEHHANFLPWQRLASETKAKLVILDYNQLNSQDISSYIKHQTKIVAFAHVSNVLGEINDVKAIAEVIKKANPSTHIVVDGAQAVPHIKVDLSTLGVDYYAFSGHKLYGPTGIGVLYVNENRVNDIQPLVVGGGAVVYVSDTSYQPLPQPQGLEAGTPPIAEAIGLGAAIDFLSSVEYPDLSAKLYQAVNSLPFTQVLGSNHKPRVPLVSFNIVGVHAHDVAQFLAENNVCVRGGHHCAMPLHTALGVPASIRASLGLYNSEADIQTLVSGLKDCNELLGAKND